MDEPSPRRLRPHRTDQGSAALETSRSAPQEVPTASSSSRRQPGTLRRSARMSGVSETAHAQREFRRRRTLSALARGNRRSSDHTAASSSSGWDDIQDENMDVPNPQPFSSSPDLSDMSMSGLPGAWREEEASGASESAAVSHRDIVASGNEEADAPSHTDGPDWSFGDYPSDFPRNNLLSLVRRERSRSNADDSERIDRLSRLLRDDTVSSLILYHLRVPQPQSNDVWPNLRSLSKAPARYYLLKKDDTRNNRGQRKVGTKNLQDLRRTLREVDQRTETSCTAEASSRDIAMASPPGWPAAKVPTEIYEEIAEHLSRDDIKAMRLVCREFDRYVSQVLFKTVVVPFNTEIYGMIAPENSSVPKWKKTVKIEQRVPLWKKTEPDDIYEGHGLDVFRGFGKHILRFGMSFEVDEDSLARPPEKTLLEQQRSFWGNYTWPFMEYCRFDDIAGLETAADETPRMTVAFSELSKVQVLALSIDSGLGWLNGPDRSIRARILQKPPQVFGASRIIADRRAQAQKELWDHIVSCHSDADDIKLATLRRMELGRYLSELEEAPAPLEKQPNLPFLDKHLIHEALPYDTTEPSLTWSHKPDVLHNFPFSPAAGESGILFTQTQRAPSNVHEQTQLYSLDDPQSDSALIPMRLSKAQKEWLLETEWAQRAFLSSYMLSIIDNPLTFRRIHTLNVSRLSDRYLSMLNRGDFWDALPNLENVILKVIPEWRTVYKHEAGFVDTAEVRPTSGIDAFYDLLKNAISYRPNITQITVGWAGGGEHAEGLHARNRLLLPAPLFPADDHPEQSMATNRNMMLRFPHAQSITIENCWMMPDVLKFFIEEHDKFCLKNLTLDSVSLTAMLRGFHHGHNIAHGLPQAQQAALLMVHQQLWQWQIANLGAVPTNANTPITILPNHGPADLYRQAKGEIDMALNMVQQQLGNAPAHVNLQMLVQQLNQALGRSQNLFQQFQQQQQNWQQSGQPFVPAAVMTTATQQYQQQRQRLVQIITQIQQVQNLFPQQQQAAAAPGVPAPPPQPHLGPAPVPQAIQNNPASAQAMDQTADGNTVLKARPREGSWVDVIDTISPGLNLSDFGSEHSSADPNRQTALETITFNSCGYARLHNNAYDQSAIEPQNVPQMSQVLSRKMRALEPDMLPTKWSLLGDIVQEIRPGELAALTAAWDFEEGWKDREAAEAAEFDGRLPGGTGRFTGVVKKVHRERVDEME